MTSCRARRVQGSGRRAILYSRARRGASKGETSDSSSSAPGENEVLHLRPQQTPCRARISRRGRSTKRLVEIWVAAVKPVPRALRLAIPRLLVVHLPGLPRVVYRREPWIVRMRTGHRRRHYRDERRTRYSAPWARPAPRSRRQLTGASSPPGARARRASTACGRRGRGPEAAAIEPAGARPQPRSIPFRPAAPRSNARAYVAARRVRPQDERRGRGRAIGTPCGTEGMRRWGSGGHDGPVIAEPPSPVIRSGRSPS